MLGILLCYFSAFVLAVTQILNIGSIRVDSSWLLVSEAVHITAGQEVESPEQPVTSAS